MDNDDWIIVDNIEIEDINIPILELEEGINNFYDEPFSTLEIRKEEEYVLLKQLLKLGSHLIGIDSISERLAQIQNEVEFAYEIKARMGNLSSQEVNELVDGLEKSINTICLLKQLSKPVIEVD